jgi:hypothetical protein
MTNATCNTDAGSKLHMFFDATEEMPTATPVEKREACVLAAIQFAKDCGCTHTDAEKLRAALIGTPNAKGEIIPGPLALVTWRIYMCNVNAIVAAKDEIWQPMAGFLPVQGRNGSTYNITLREDKQDDRQVTLGISIQKKGSALVEGKGQAIQQPFFWTYAAVTLTTESRKSQANEVVPGLPLSLAFDVNAAADAGGKGKSLSGQWSRRLYIQRSPNPLTGVVETTNRLSDLVRGTNDELVFLGAIIDAGFPVDTARINRSPVTQSGQWQPRGPQRQAQSLVGAGVTAPQIQGDPFAADGE